MYKEAEEVMSEFMKNLMNKDIYAITEQEKKLCKKIEQMNNTNEIQQFVNDLENELKGEVKIFSYRIKKIYSALRTYRLANYSKAEQLHDLLGILIVVDKKSEIIKIESKIKRYFNNEKINTYNMLNEIEFKAKRYNTLDENIKNNQYNELIFKDISTWLEMPKELDKLLPPFSYNILFERKFIGVDTPISIEIRIQTKEDFITTEAYYYTIHKNDEIKLNLKIPLLCMSFRLLRRMSNIAFEENDIIKNKYKMEIDEIQNENINFIKQNKEYLEKVFLEHNYLVNCWKNKLPIYSYKIIK